MTMTIDQFIKANNIRPADAVKMTKKFFGMLDHYVIYLGIQHNNHKFVANYTNGINIIPDHELAQFVQVLLPSAIEHFPGNDYQRQFAIQRAFLRIGERAYGLLSNNCEHFKNWVHYGQETSTQVVNFAGGMMVGGIMLSLHGASRKNNLLTGIGILAALLGVATYYIEKKYPNDN